MIINVLGRIVDVGSNGDFDNAASLTYKFTVCFFFLSLSADDVDGGFKHTDGMSTRSLEYWMIGKLTSSSSIWRLSLPQ